MKQRVKEKRERKLQQQQQELEQRQRNKRFMIMLVSVLAVIVAGLIIVAATHKTPTASTGSAASFDYANHPMIGQDSAPVKVVEFGDFKCTACQYFAEKIYPTIKSKYIDTGKIQYYFYNYPFIGPDSTTAALAAESVYHQNPQAFWQYYDALYQNQGAETADWATPDFLVSLAQKAGLKVDAGTLKNDIVNKKYLAEVTADKKKGDALKLNGTPTLFVNGKVVSDNATMNLAQFEQVLDAALKDVQK